MLTTGDLVHMKGLEKLYKRNREQKFARLYVDTFRYDAGSHGQARAKPNVLNRLVRFGVSRWDTAGGPRLQAGRVGLRA